METPIHLRPIEKTDRSEGAQSEANEVVLDYFRANGALESYLSDGASKLHWKTLVEGKVPYVVPSHQEKPAPDFNVRIAALRLCLFRHSPKIFNFQGGDESYTVRAVAKLIQDHRSN